MKRIFRVSYLRYFKSGVFQIVVSSGQNVYERRYSVSRSSLITHYVFVLMTLLLTFFSSFSV
jgi:hypothetical protein